LKKKAATNGGVTSPTCAAPSGFLNLLTPCSALFSTALFHAESVHGVETPRGFPLPIAAATYVALCPSPLHFQKMKTKKSGIHALGRSVLAGAVLPGFQRPILSQPSSPSRNSPLESWFHVPVKPPLMGFSTTPNMSVVVDALQSFKEPEGRLISFENCRPPWSFVSANLNEVVIRQNSIGHAL
jgi:hypothetical protein